MTLAHSSHSAARLAHLRPCPAVIWSPSLPPFAMCTDHVGGKEKGTTHLPGEGAIWGGMWKVTIATKRGDKEIKA